MLRPFSGYTFGSNICIPFGSPISGWAFTSSASGENNVISGGPAIECARLSKAYHYDGALFQEFANNEPCIGPQGLYVQGTAANVVKYSEAFQGAGWSGVAAVTNSSAIAPLPGGGTIKTLRDSSFAELRYRRFTVDLADLLTTEKEGNFLYSGMLIARKVAASEADGEYLSCLRIQHIEGIDVPSVYGTHDIRVIFDPRTGQIHRTYYITQLSEGPTSGIVPIETSGAAFFSYYVEEGTLYGPSIQLDDDYYAIPIKLRHRASAVESELIELYGSVPSAALTDVHPTTSLFVEIYPAYTYTAEDRDGVVNAVGSLDIFALHFGNCAALNSLMRTTTAAVRRQADHISAPISPGITAASFYARTANDAGLFAASNVLMRNEQANPGGGGAVVVLSDQSISTFPAQQVIAQIETDYTFPASPDAVRALVETGTEWSGRASNEIAPHTTVGGTFDENAHNLSVATTSSVPVRFSLDGQPANTADENAPAGMTFERFRFGNNEDADDATALCAHIRSAFIYDSAADDTALENISGSCQT